MFAWNCAEAVRTLRAGRGKHFFRWNGEESRFPDPRPVPWFARCPKSSRFSPSALAPSSLVLWRMEPPPGKAWGCPPHTPGRGESPAPRKNAAAFFRMLWDHRSYGGTVEVFPGGSRSIPCRARCPNRPNCRNRPESSRKKRRTCFHRSAFSDFHSELSRKTYFISFPTS